MDIHDSTQPPLHSFRGPRPPRALLLSILAQMPGALALWPPSHDAASVSLGAGLLVAGGVLNIWSVKLFQSHETGVCPFSRVGNLVKDGPYCVSRNPMYLGLVLVSAGIALISGFAGNLWAAALLALYLHFGFVVREEAFLREQLGAPYVDYASRTSRWLGLPGSVHGNPLTVLRGAPTGRQ